MIYSIVFSPLFIFIYGGIAFCGLVNIIKSPKLVPRKSQKWAKNTQKEAKNRAKWAEKAEKSVFLRVMRLVSKNRLVSNKRK